MQVRTLAFGYSFFTGTMNQPAGISFAVIVNLRAEERVVNSQKVVQCGDRIEESYGSGKQVISSKSRDEHGVWPSASLASEDATTTWVFFRDGLCTCQAQEMQRSFGSSRRSPTKVISLAGRWRRRMSKPLSGVNMKVSVVAVSILACSMVCVAQEPSTADQDQSRSVVAAAKASRTVIQSKDAKEADIRKLLELTHAGEMATQTMQAMEANIRPLMINAFPAGEYRDKLIELFFEKFHSKLDAQQMVDLAVPVYAKYYSDDEIKQLIQIYQTPLGQKMLASMPKLLAELQAAGEKHGEEVGRQSMLEVLDEHPEMQKALENAQKTAQAAR